MSKFVDHYRYQINDGEKKNDDNENKIYNNK